MVINLPGKYVNTSSDQTVVCVKCKKPIERRTMFIEHTFEDSDKKEVICHFCYYQMKQDNKL